MADLTTAAKVKEFMGITHSDWDALIASLITRMSSFIEDYCGVPFSSTDYTDERYDGLEFNGGVLRLKNYPIISVASLYDDTSRDFQSDALIATDDYVWYADEGVVRMVDGGVFNEGEQNIKITYTAGYTEVPSAIDQVCIELVTAKLKDRGMSGLVQSEKLGRWSVTYWRGTKIEVSASALEALERYRRKDLHVV